MEHQEIKPLVTARARAQGVLTRHSNSMQRLMLDQPQGNEERFVELKNKVNAAKDAYEEAHQNLVDKLGELNEDIDEAENAAVEIDTKFTELLVAAHKWNITKTDETSQEMSLAAEHGGDGAGVGNGSGGDHEPNPDREKEQLRVQLEEMSKELDRLRLLSVHVPQRGTSTPNVNVGGTRHVTFGEGVGDPSAIGVRGDETPFGSRGDVDMRSRGFGRGKGRALGALNRTESIVGHTNSAAGVDGIHRRDLFGAHDASVQQQFMQQSYLQHKSFMASMQAPAVVLDDFHGDPLKYTSFVSAYQDLVYDVLDNDRSKLLILLRHCKGKANTAIAGCEYMSAKEGVIEALKILKAKFGTPFVIAQAWIQKILSYPVLNTADLLETFAHDLDCCRLTLLSLNRLGEIECVNNLSIIVSKLPVYVRNKWRKVHRQLESEERSSPLSALVTLVKESAEEATDPAYGEAAITRIKQVYSGSAIPSSRVGKQAVQIGVRKQAVNMVDETDCQSGGDDSLGDDFESAEVYAVSKPNPTCASCGTHQHFTFRCRKYRELSAVDRLRFVRKNKLCHLCLSDSHLVMSCPLPWKCQDRQCGRKHHTSLHGAFITEAAAEPTSASKPAHGAQSVNNIQKDPSVDVTGDVYLTSSSPCLPLTPVILKNGERRVKSFALLDSGSTMTLCNQRLVEELRLESLGTSRARVSTVTDKADMIGQLVKMEISPADDSAVYPIRKALTVPKLPISLEHLARGSALSRWDHLKGLEIEMGGADQVDILIGQNNAHLLEHFEKMTGKDYEPYGVLTRLGWTIWGNLGEGKYEDECAAMAYDTEFVSGSLESEVVRFFEIESVPEIGPFTAEEQKVIDLWEREFKIVDGHVQLPIPFKENASELQNNYFAALKSLEALGRRLMKNPGRLGQYRTAMLKNLVMNYMEPVPEEEIFDFDGIVFYLLHHDVDHPRKVDVVRVVGNGSAKYKGLSLNMVAMKGPDLMNGLMSVIVKFRQKKYGTTGDIEGMYNQVKVPPKQRNAQRILFWEDGDPTKPVKVYRMTGHIFGTIWAPAAANYALKRIAQEQREVVGDKVVKSIENEFYVDDWLNSEHEEEESARMAKMVKDTIAKGHFNLEKFGGSSRSVIQSIDVKDRAKELKKIDLAADHLPKGVTLGQLWNTEEDSFGFSISPEPRPFTRRGMVSCISSVFDPLGLLCPFVLPAKLLMREACKGGKPWDEQLPGVLAGPWARWLEALPAVNSFDIPRWLGCTATSENTLHNFGDGSEAAYGAVSFMVTKEQEEDEAKALIVAAKSKVAPSNYRTIPRVELAAAVLAVKLDAALKEYLTVELNESEFYSDSDIILKMMLRDPLDFKPFFRNRLAFIKELTSVKQWNWISGKENPADLASRGATICELQSSMLWKHGPDVIRKIGGAKIVGKVELDDIPDDFPELKTKKPIFMTAEVKKRKFVTATLAPVNDGLVKLLSLHSSFMKVKRRAAWILRAFDACKSGRWRVGQLSVWELDRAELAVLRLSQELYLTESQKTSRAFVKLFPRDKNGLAVVGGRLQYSQFPEWVKHPIVIPCGAPAVEQIILDAHNEVGHAGVDRTLAAIRKKYWLLEGKVAVGRLLRQCMMCRRLKAPVEQQLMAPLPASRLASGVPPFTNTGVDLFGPLTVAVRRSSEKRYGVLFTCLTCRAVYLDVAIDLSTSAFLDVMERFANRRGKPRRIQSDNGTNFIGARNVIYDVRRLANDESLVKALADQGIQWETNTPAGSHQGGVWERMIRSVRSILLVLLTEQRITEDRLRTVLCTAEGIINGRPLTRLANDDEVMEPLSPSHILIMQSMEPLIPGNFTGDQLRRDWRQTQYLAGSFWKRWLDYYLPELQKRTKWSVKLRDIRVGELVAILKEHVPRGKWPLAVVAEVHPGQDNVVRNVTLRTADGTLRRPVQKIVRLEADLEENG